MFSDSFLRLVGTSHKKSLLPKDQKQARRSGYAIINRQILVHRRKAGNFP